MQHCFLFGWAGDVPFYLSGEPLFWYHSTVHWTTQESCKEQHGIDRGNLSQSIVRSQSVAKFHAAATAFVGAARLARRNALIISLASQIMIAH